MTQTRGKEFLLLLAVLLVMLGIAEAVVRWWFPPDEVGVLIARDGRRIQSFFYQTPDGVRMERNARLDVLRDKQYGRTYTIETNSLGLRNSEVGEKTRPRILFLGDSITEGWAVNSNETFVRRVEKLAQEHGKDFEFINAGVPGLSTFDEIALLKENIAALKPDVVVLDFYLNDATSCCVRPIKLPPLPYARSWLIQSVFRNFYLYFTRDFQYSDVPEAALENWRREIRTHFPGKAGAPEITSAGFHARVLKDVADWGNAWTKDAWDELHEAFYELNNMAVENNFQLLVVGFSNVPQILAPSSETYPQQRLKKLTDKLSLPFLDLLPLIRETAMKAPVPFFLDHCHLAPYGHKVISELIWEFLESHQNPAQ